MLSVNAECRHLSMYVLFVWHDFLKRNVTKDMEIKLLNKNDVDQQKWIRSLQLYSFISLIFVTVICKYVTKKSEAHVTRFKRVREEAFVKEVFRVRRGK
jgi:hypothetical protein